MARNLIMMFSLINILSPINLWAERDCEAMYREHLTDNKKYKRAHKANERVLDGPDAMANICYGSVELIRLPHKVGTWFVKKTIDHLRYGPECLIPAVGAVVVPVVMVPFVAIGAIALPVIGVPVVATGMVYEQRHVTTSYKHTRKLMALMHGISHYRTGYVADRALSKFIQKDEIQDNFENTSIALETLKKAYDYKYFYQEIEGLDEPLLMDMKDILESISDGSLKEFVSSMEAND